MATTSIRTSEHRQEARKALRDKCPRLAHGKVILGHGDKRDVIALIKASNEGRLEDLIPVRHGRMLQSPFAFFRGSAAIQAYDLDRTPTSGIDVQACGDCHLMRMYARLCGLALARAHDKAGDAAMIAGYLGSRGHFDQAIGDYAVAYADQVERDYATFVTAVRNGRLKSDLSPRQLETVLT
jgi:hypothetical protein